MIAALLAVCAFPANPQALDGFAERVRDAVAAWEIPGTAVAVVKDGETVFAEGFGVREVGGDDRVGPRTLFAIGSTTKAMTAAAVGMLVDEGKVAWNDRVIDHLKDFRLHDPYVTRELRVRDLLTHNAGLGNADFLWYEVDTTTAEILERIRYQAPEYSLRGGFVYQNIMYAAAGELIATVSGSPWAEFVTSRIFEPLGMDRTIATAATLADQSDVAAPHFRIDGTIERIDNASVDAVAAAGSVWSCVGDMAKWLRFLLAEGETAGGRRLLTKATVHELFEPQVIVDRQRFYPTRRLTKPHWITYGLGWFQHDYGGRAIDFHTGSIDGMVAIAGLIRDENLGVYVLSNLDHAELRHALMYDVFDRFGDDRGRDWYREIEALYASIRAETKAARDRAVARRVPDTAPALDLARYAGAYSDRLYGTAVITLRDGALHVRYGPGLQGTLEHWHYDTFRATLEARWRPAPMLTFRLDQHGQPSELSFGGRPLRRAPTSPDK